MNAKPFIYGKFGWENKPPSKSNLPSSVPAMIRNIADRERVAIEVLREFSATEFVGKLYGYSGSPLTWKPLDMATVEQQSWFHRYRVIPKQFREKGSGFYFVMEGTSDRWSVLYIRGESDDTGPYVAVALRY